MGRVLEGNILLNSAETSCSAAMLWDSLDKFLEKAYRKSKSLNSVRHYRVGVQGFKASCDSKGVTPDSENVYGLLDDWVGEMDKAGSKPNTVINKVSAVRRFLAYNDIVIDRDRFKDKVTLPRTRRTADEPLAMDTVRILLTKGRPSPKIRALILTLLSSAIRIAEALNLRWKDVNLEADPATINIREEITKTNEARVAYVSQEAKEALRPLKTGAKEDDLVFSYSGPMQQRMKVVQKVFRNLVKRTGLDRTLEGHRMHAIHFHLFRKYYFTKAVDSLGEVPAHAMLGHRSYLDTYFLKTEDERAADYRKLEPHLTTTASQGVTEQRVDEATRLSILKALGYSPEEIEKLKPKILDDAQWGRTFQERIREKLVQAAKVLGPLPMVLTSGFCTQCGTQISANVRYCRNCGARVGSE